jgi:diaminohydroxyphosphoribosylaminopyrimidine deaminase/5-amino-6-(5-phosphoribosylamino)uracil reductase
MIGAQLIGDEEEEIRSFDHARRFPVLELVDRSWFGVDYSTVTVMSRLDMTDGDGSDDVHFMALALALGNRGLGRTWPNPSVGAVVVRDDGAGPMIVGRGWTQPGGRPHAETEALRRAGAAARGGTLYVTLEPCSHHGKTPPCADAIITAGIARVVSAIEDPNPQIAGAGHRRLADSGLTVEIGLGAQEAKRAHAGHIRRVRDGRPHVTLKLAVSADGKVGLAGRRPVPITGEAARRRVHRLRAMNDAVLTAIGTALADDPLLTCRLPGMANRSPVRIVLDGRLRLPIDSRLVRTAGETALWVMTSDDASWQRGEALLEKGAEVLRASEVNGRIDLGDVLRRLAKRGITRLMVEAGPTIAAAFLQADLVDEVMLLRSQDSIGNDGLDALEGMPLEALTRSPHLIFIGTERAGADTIEHFLRP